MPTSHLETTRNIEVKMANGRLSLMDAEQLQSTMSYARIVAGNIKQASIEIKNGQLHIQSIGTLTLTSSNSSVSLEKVDSLRIRDSQADNFDIRLADFIAGRKYFGDMQLAKLTGSIDMDGQNASMKVKSISSSATLVKINNQYANVQLSVEALKNYTVAFEGKGGSVSAPFKKTAVSKTSFNSKIGNVKYNPTVFQLSCNDCKLNFD